MSSTPKLHRKLKSSKEAVVSLDTLLGLLSSAYGIEELDSKVLFEKSDVDLRNLSVENLKAVLKTAEGVDDQKKIEEAERVSISTSTTGLKRNKGSETEIDVTLVSIKSLESFKQTAEKCGDVDVTESTQLEAEECKQTSEVATEEVTDVEHMDQKPSSEVFVDVVGAEQTNICSFFVNDINKQTIINIQFTKKITKIELFPDFNFNEPEVSINVTDVLKHTKSCFKLTKSCMVSKFGYFADIDKEYGLENLNVCLDCNIKVFQWIVQWVKADIEMCRPNLNVSNLMNILLIAYHLRAEKLLDECLNFFHTNCRSALEYYSDIENFFDDKLIAKYTKLVTNSEVDEISDDHDSFKMKLFCSLIELLVDPDPCTSVGHFCSLATIFQCANCEKLLPQDMMDFAVCRSDCMQMDDKGELRAFHELSSSWDLSRYVELMFGELGSWRLVYWRLWGMCHFLTCVVCHLSYPLSQSDWCPYHTAEVEYFPLNSKLFYPIGMYQCCGEKAFRFNTLEPCGGCKFRSHTPQLDSEKSANIFEIFQKHQSFIKITIPETSENCATKKFVKLLKSSGVSPVQNETHVNSFWWLGIQLAPKKRKDYSIIPMKVLNHLRNRPQQQKCTQIFKPLIFESEVHFGMMPSSTKLAVEEILNENETSSSNGKKNKSKSLTCKMKSYVVTGTGMKTKKKRSTCYYEPTEALWSNYESSKDNQDNQRDFEEIAMRNLVTKLTPEFQGVAGDPIAGSYLRLESQWWQNRWGDSKTGKNTGTVVNRTFPLSWYRRISL